MWTRTAIINQLEEADARVMLKYVRVVALTEELRVSS